MASGTRSIVWRSDIDAGRERPAFFCAAKRSGQSAAGKAQLMGQLAAQLSSTQLFQLLLAREGRGERLEERRRAEESGGEGRSYLLNK